MKRDLDLCRQLLLDLEAQGPDCALNVLRTGLAHDAEERVRFHVRLLLDAGLVREADRTINGVSCVRLTHAGCELLDLCRDEAVWNDAKACVRERTGSLSLTLVRNVLIRWALEAVADSARSARTPRPYFHRPSAVRPTSGALYERYRERRDALTEEEAFRLVRSRPEYRERLDWRYDLGQCDYEASEGARGSSLPIYLG